MLVAASLELKAETPSTHSGPAVQESVAFSPDGKSIVSGSKCISDGEMQLRVWDAGVSALAHPNP